MEAQVAKKSFDLKTFLKWAFIVGAVGFGIYILVAVIIACVAPNHINAVISTTLFSDFAETLAYASVPNAYNGAYGIRTFYPPLSFLIFWPFIWFCRGQIQGYVAGDVSLAQLASNPGFICAYLLYFAINLAIIMYVVARMSKLKGWDLFYLLSLVVFCGPLLFEFVRANNTLTTCIFALLFFYFNGRKDEENKLWRKELSYVFLALAACMKIYPAFMILFLVWREKGWNKLWSVLQTLGFTLIFVFLPFLFTEGGFANVAEIWKNFRGFSGASATAAAGGGILDTLGGNAGDYLAESVKWGTNISIETITFYFSYLLSMIFGGANLSLLQHILSMILRYSLLIFAVVLPFISFKSKKYKEFVVLAIGTYMLFPGVCNGYCLTLMIIPFIITILEWNTLSKGDKIFYAICYGLLMFAPLYTFNVFILSAIATLAIVAKSIVDIMKDDVKTFKQMHQERKAKKVEVTTEPKPESK